MIKYQLFLVLFLLTSITLSAQQSDQDKKSSAKQLIYNARFDEALQILKGSGQLTEKDEEARFLSGICYYQLNDLEKAESIFLSLIKKDRPAFVEVLLFLGKTYHFRHEFSKAAEYYKSYLQSIKKDAPSRTVVLEELRRASNGISIQFKEQVAVVENLGNSVNTVDDEFAPVLSPNYREKLYFSSIRKGNTGGRRNEQGKRDEANGQYYSDIFYCTIEGGAWVKVQSMGPYFNSPAHEILLDFNRDGSALLYFSGTSMNKGEIMVDTFKQNREKNQISSPFVGPLYAMSGDGAPYFANDTTLFFSSNRAGGFGGADLYKSIYRNGRWSTPENLGPAINTPFEETSPFLARDGKTLYFSSNNSRKSIGGLDIFKTTFDAEKKIWTEPANVGLPINSAGDDDYFRLTEDGYAAFFSSSRKDGFGLRDIYVAYFDTQQAEQEISVPELASEESPSNLTEENKDRPDPRLNHPEMPDAISIFFRDEFDILNDTNKIVLNKIAQLHADNPELSILVTGFSVRERSLAERLFNAVKNAEKAKSYLEKKGVSKESIIIRSADLKDFNLKGESEEDQSHSKIVFSLANLNDVNAGLAQFANINTHKSTAVDYNKLLSEQLFYKVQIASVKKPYQNQFFAKYPDAMMEKSTVEGYYRCTLGLFGSFEEAHQLRKALQNDGFKSAFVVPYIFGVRIEKKDARRYSDKFPDLANYIRG